MMSQGHIGRVQEAAVSMTGCRKIVSEYNHHLHDFCSRLKADRQL